MKIAVVTPYFYPDWEYGGTPRAAFELARALAARGHEIRVLTTGSEAGSRIVEGIQVRYYRNLSNGLARHYRLFIPPGFRKELRQQLSGCDVLHIHEFRSTLTVPAARAAQELSLPYLISPHGGLRYLGKRTAKRIFDALWGRSIMDRAAGVIALTEKEGAEAQSFGIPESRIRLLDNVIDASAYESLPKRRSSRQTILFLGRLNRIKGIDILLDAFKGIDGAQLVIAGPDDGETAHIPSTPDILKPGFLDHQAKLQAIADSDVVVLPSRSEASPVVLYEALLCKRPVVVSSACELPMAEPAKYGILQFQSLQAADLRDKLLFALADPHLSDNAAVGRDFVLRKFSPLVVAEQAERIYEEAIFRGSRQPQA
ncbi:MAG TPA: glycosyltransferase [Terriglobia bacterium]|jgi:glycosyltransferase involved in cell wall biosynthesis